MKNKFNLLFALITLSFQTVAQFNPSDIDQNFDCTIILKSGETKNLMVRYNHPDFLKSANHPLESTTEGFIDKRLIETFYINNQCWVERPTPIGNQWAILNRQGAIEDVIYVKSESKGKNPAVISAEYISKNGRTESVAMMALGYKKKMAEFVNDYPELARKITDGEKGYGFITLLKVIDEYNAWFDKTNPDKIKYYPWFNKAKQGPPSLAEAKQILKQTKDSIANVHASNAAARPKDAEQGIASKKPNLPPKKETFSAKVKRYETDGHKIAVVMQEQKTRFKATIRGTIANPKDVGFSEKPEVELIDEGILENTVSDLNKLYNTTIFEAVTLDRIPLIQGKSGQVDDWWSTCYKTVVYLSHLRDFSCTNDIMTEGAFEGTGSLSLYTNVFEYLDDGKQGVDILKRLYALGYGISDPFKYTNNDWPLSFEFLEKKVDWEKVKQRYEKKRNEQFGKLVDKWE